ncbi:MAG: saccharopine dehydrogenase NADP-binding domain-containing protein [Gemmatimonadaceae bacterium]|nr:saccharopine dehydrogenase NADP-binding domain-containing protein [Gemmatimonadaceae bacterium]
MRFLVLGRGAQGSACAFDLLRSDGVSQVRLADLDVSSLPSFLPTDDPRLVPVALDVRNREMMLAEMGQVDAVLSAIPYYFNGELAALAVQSGVHFADLGGNTEIVFQQKELDTAAKLKNVTVIPDTGLAPGMINVLAEHGIRAMDSVESVKLFVGGLPQHPEPPLNYQIVYSIEGVLDYYSTLSWVLRDGIRTQVTALSELEPVQFDEPIGALEAFHTAGGLSTMAWRYEGTIPLMEYKTLRYPGHAQLMSAMRDLGLFDSTPIDVKGVQVVPRDLFIAQVGPKLRRPGGQDLVALRVIVTGMKNGHACTREYDLLDYYDAEHDITAMMRVTGYTLSITGQLMASGALPSGVYTPDEVFPGDRYIAELAKRNINIRMR